MQWPPKLERIPNPPPPKEAVRAFEAGLKRKPAPKPCVERQNQLTPAMEKSR